MAEKNLKYFVLCKPNSETLRHDTGRLVIHATLKDAIEWRDKARKTGRIKYDLWEVTKIEEYNEG